VDGRGGGPLNGAIFWVSERASEEKAKIFDPKKKTPNVRKIRGGDLTRDGVNCGPKKASCNGDDIADGKQH